MLGNLDMDAVAWGMVCLALRRKQHTGLAMFVSASDVATVVQRKIAVATVAILWPGINAKRAVGLQAEIDRRPTPREELRHHDRQR